MFNVIFSSYNATEEEKRSCLGASVKVVYNFNEPTQLNWGIYAIRLEMKIKQN